MAKRTAFLFFETGMPTSIPGIAEGTPWSLFPVWGNYHLLDVLLGSLGDFGTLPFDLHFFLLEPYQESVLSALSFWQREQRTSLLTLSSNPDGFLSWLKQSEYDKLVLMRSTFAAEFALESLRAVISLRSTDPCGLSIKKRSADFFICGAKRLAALLDSHSSQAQTGGRAEDSLAHEWITTLFKKLKKETAGNVRDLGGRMILQNSPMDLFREHIRFVTEKSSPGFPNSLLNLAARKPLTDEAVITETGEVSHSFVAAGSTIAGTVRNSVIFRNVTVESGAIISDSVIMSGQRIGKNADISNTLILPCTKSRNQNNATIGADAKIGGKKSESKNRTFPALIQDGLTVIGMNTEVPQTLRIEPASFLAANLPKTRLMRYNKIERGTSIVDKE